MSSATTRGTAVRGRVLSAAQSVFAARGFDAGSLNDVAEQAGMSRHNLLYYYPSKKQLLVALLEARDADFDARLQWMESPSHLSYDDFVQRLVELMPAIYADRELVLLYHRLTIEAADPDHPAHEWVLSRYRRTRAAARRVIEDAIAHDVLSPDLDIDGLVAALLGAIEGIEAQWLVEPELDWNRATGALLALMRLATKPN